MMMKTMEPGTAAAAMNEAVRPTREFDKFVESEQDQLVAFNSLMRRVEDLADRVLGSIPATDSSKEHVQPYRAGHFGGLLDAQEARAMIGHRISDALLRLEQVL